MSNDPSSDRVRVMERPASPGQSPAEDVQRYARRRYGLFVGHLAVGVAFLVMMVGGGSTVIAREAREIAGPGAFLLEVFYYFTGFSLAYLVVTLPLTFYGGHVLEHQFGLSTQSLGRWFRRRLKKWFLSFVIAAPLVLAFYWLLRRSPRGWWLPASAGWILFSFVLTRFAPRILIPIFYKLVKIDDEGLTARLAGLAAKAGVHLAGAYRIDLSRETKKANAAVVGMGRTRRVVLGDTLLRAFDHDEIASVFAHELGHIVHRDVRKGFVMASTLAAGGLFLGSIVLRRFAIGAGIPVYSPETFPVLVAVLAGLQLFVMPFEKWYSRWRELRCDAYALRATGGREAFISAMKKLGAMNLADVHPNKLAELLLFSHPPIAKRIRFAQRFDLDVAT